MNNKVTL